MTKEVLIIISLNTGPCKFYADGTYLTPDAEHEEDFSFWKVEEGKFYYRHSFMPEFTLGRQGDEVAQRILFELELNRILEST